MKPLKLAIGAVIVAIATVTATMAWGFWSAPATGHGTGATSTFGITATGVVTSEGARLVPGGTGDVTFTVHNPNTFPVTVTVAFDAGRPITVDPADSGCDGSAMHVLDPLLTPIPLVVPPGAAAASVTATGAVTMDSEAPSGCQGATFSVPVVVTAEVVQ